MSFVLLVCSKRGNPSFPLDPFQRAFHRDVVFFCVLNHAVQQYILKIIQKILDFNFVFLYYLCMRFYRNALFDEGSKAEESSQKYV